MTTVISDANIKNFKNDNSDIINIIAGWDIPCDAVKQCLTGDVGSVFNEHFGVGRNAHAKITALIGILQEMEGSIKTLINNTNTFLDEHSNANVTTF